MSAGGGGLVDSAATFLQPGLSSFQPGLQLQQRPLLGQSLHPPLRKQRRTSILTPTNVTGDSALLYSVFQPLDLQES